MKLTTRPPKNPSFTHVRGGHVLRTKVELVVPRDGTPEESFGQKLEQRSGFVTTRIGDLALEVVNVNGNRVIGHYFLSGPALGIVRYATINGNQPEPIEDLNYFERGVKAVRVDIDPAHAEGMEQALKGGSQMGWFTSCFVELARNYELAHFGNLHTPNLDTMRAALSAILRVYEYARDEHGPVKCHVMGEVHCPPVPAAQRIQGHQPVGYVHCQPPADVNQMCCSPFGHELFDGADLEAVDFWTLDGALHRTMGAMQS